MIDVFIIYTHHHVQKLSISNSHLDWDVLCPVVVAAAAAGERTGKTAGVQPMIADQVMYL